MELKGITARISNTIKKYKYVVLIALVGVFLMLIPSKDKSQKSEFIQSEAASGSYAIEEELVAVLSATKGVGSVKVLLTTASGEETVYQSDIDSDIDQNGTQKTSKTVMITDSQRNATGLVRQVKSPTYLGAVIVCQGADDPVVKLAVVDAVSKSTGLGSNCISVLKMK